MSARIQLPVVDLKNTFAREGCDQCYCGCKYWENDKCIDCGTMIESLLEDPEWVRDNRETFLDD